MPDGQQIDWNKYATAAPSAVPPAIDFSKYEQSTQNAGSEKGVSAPNDTGVWAGIKRNTAGMVAGIYHALSDPATDEEKAALAPKEIDVGDGRKLQTTGINPVKLLYHRLASVPAEQLEAKGTSEVDAARDLLSRGETLRGANQYLSGRVDQGLSMIPMIGPWINSVATRAESGDTSGAATDIAFAVAMENAREIKNAAWNDPLVKSVRQAAAEQIAGPIVRKTPTATMNDLKFGRSPADAITKEPGLEGVTVSGLRDGVVKRMDEIGQAMDAKLQAVSQNAKPIDVEPIIDKAYQDAVGSPMARLNQGLTNRLFDQANALKTKFGALQKDPFEATQFKREVGQAAKWTGQPFDNEANQMLVDVYRGVKDEVNNAVPEVKDLNERYADLLSAKTALERRIAYNANRPWSIGRGLLGVGGGAAGTILGGAAGGGAGAAVGAAADVLRSEPSRIILGKTLGVKHPEITTVPVAANAAPATATTPVVPISPITGGVLQTPAQLFKNASSESAASAEGISRAASERAQGVKYFMEDTRSGVRTPLSSIDANQITKLAPFKRIIKTGTRGEEVFK